MEMGIAAKNAEACRIVNLLYALSAMRTVGAGSSQREDYPPPLAPPPPPPTFALRSTS